MIGALGIIAAIALIGFVGIQLYVTQSVKSYIIRDAADLPQADAIMVLGAMVYSDGRPSMILADRLDHAYELYALGKAPKILVTGDHGRKEYNEVRAMSSYLLELGVPREDIFMDHAGFNTYDSMYRARDIFGIERLLVCTQEFHMGRSLFIARALGIDAYGYPAEDKAIYKMGWNHFRESGARLKAVRDVMLKRQPAFLGEPIPITGSGVATED